jgi:Viral BACON domain
MQTCKNCQSTLSHDARICPFCGSPVQKNTDDSRRHLLLRLRLRSLPAPIAATASAITYLIASTLILAYVIVGVFLRPPAIRSAPPILNVTPLILDFGKVVAGDKQTQTLTVMNRSGLPLHWTAETKASWLRLDTSSGDLSPRTQQIVRATVDTNGLPSPPVPYSVTISFNAGDMSIPVKTTVTVIAPGKLCVRPNHLEFGALERGTPGMRFVTVGNCGAQPLNWFLAPGKESWVALSATQGTIGPGGQQTVQVTVDTSQLTPSTTAYPTSLTFSSDKGVRAVSLTVIVASQPPPQHVPNWSVDPRNLNPGNAKCGVNRGSWICTVALTEDTNSQGNINWSSNSNLGATFDPSHGLLKPGGLLQVKISSISCQQDTFTFYGAEGEIPITISWSCTPPCIKVDKPSLSMTVMQGQPSNSQSVTFTNCGVDRGNISVLPTTADGAPWLSISSAKTESLNGALASGMREGVSISVTSGHLQPGTYQGIITASITTNTGTNSATTNIALTVSPCFTVNQSSFSFTSPPVQNGIQKVTFTNCGTYAGDVSISSSANDNTNWLSIDSYDSQQTSGLLEAGATDDIYFNVSDTDPAPATYQGTISATLTTNGIAASAPVSVKLTVLSPPHMTVSSFSLDFGSVQQGQTASKQLTIGNTGEQTLSWNGQIEDVTWVIPDTSKGTILGNREQPIQVTVDTSQLQVSDYAYTAILTFNSNADNSLVQVTITLIVVLPPNMLVSSTTLSPTVCSDAGTPTATTTNITITNNGGGTLIWTVGTPSATWLTVSNGSGSDGPGQTTTLTFYVNPAAWSQTGQGSATVNIMSQNGYTTPVTVIPAFCIQ